MATDPDHVLDRNPPDGRAVLGAALRDNRVALWAVGVFSLFVNMLMLTGPLYMLNIYDRVLQARSVETLVALTGLAAFLFLMMGCLDFIRGRIMARIGARVQARLDPPVLRAGLRSGPMQAATTPAASLADLQAVHRLITSPAALALFDLPWTPLFFIGLFIFDPWMGWFGLAGAAVLVGVAIASQLATAGLAEQAAATQATAARLGAGLRQDHASLRAMGMSGAGLRQWQRARLGVLDLRLDISDRAGAAMAFAKAFRLFLQSAILGLGAYLVLQGQVSAGAMIAAAILLGRALAPIDTLLGQWPVVARGRAGWRALGMVLGAVPAQTGQMALPDPVARIMVDRLTVCPPHHGKPALRLVDFAVEPGHAVGVIGATGAGKTALALALTGIWPPIAGQIRLDDIPLGQLAPDLLGRLIGYLPQQPRLFDGTIRDNIARLAAPADQAAVVLAAKAAGAHRMILSLPQGYDTQVTAGEAGLSGGQVQLVGLARALFGDPAVLVLDEPYAALDHDGTLALEAAIMAFKAKGGIVFVMTHRQAALTGCDLILVLENGVQRAFGEKAATQARPVPDQHTRPARRTEPGQTA